MDKAEVKELISETIKEVLHEILRSYVSDERFGSKKVRLGVLITETPEIRAKIEEGKALLFGLWTDECKYDSKQIEQLSKKLDQILNKLP